MSELDPKVKNVLAKLDALFQEKVTAMSLGLPVFTLDVEIKTLIGALRIIEGRANG